MPPVLNQSTHSIVALMPNWLHPGSADQAAGLAMKPVNAFRRPGR